MKKFIVFAWYSGESHGGLNDIVGSFDTIDDARNEANDYINAHIVNRETWEIVYNESY